MVKKHKPKKSPARKLPLHERDPARNPFASVARKIATYAGHPAAFLGASAIVLTWAAVGKLFDFSDTWQLVINTGTTIVTFLMVFLIQNTQNRDMYALQLKLDELIRATEGVHTVLLDIEEMSDEELLELHNRYEELASKARNRLRTGKTDIDRPEIRLQ